MIFKSSVRNFVLLGVSLAILAVAGSAQAVRIDNNPEGTVVIKGSRLTESAGWPGNLRWTDRPCDDSGRPWPRC